MVCSWYKKGHGLRPLRAARRCSHNLCSSTQLLLHRAVDRQKTPWLIVLFHAGELSLWINHNQSPREPAEAQALLGAQLVQQRLVADADVAAAAAAAAEQRQALKQGTSMSRSVRASLPTSRCTTLPLISAAGYHSYAGHYKEADTFMALLEPLFYRYQVDLVGGRIHARGRRMGIRAATAGCPSRLPTLGPATCCTPRVVQPPNATTRPAFSPPPTLAAGLLRARARLRAHLPGVPLPTGRLRPRVHADW